MHVQVGSLQTGQKVRIRNAVGQLLRVDTSIETGLGSWLAAQGLPQVGGGLQMQKGELPESPSRSHTVFALASQALG